MSSTDLQCLVTKRIRGYFAPVNRTVHTGTIFDPGKNGGFAFDSPPEPWVDLGWMREFKRKSDTVVVPLRTGVPSTAITQVRTSIDATVELAFESWGKLQLSLAAGTQQMNVLAVKDGAISAGSGGAAVPATALSAGSSAVLLQIGTQAASNFYPGQWVAVDIDCAPNLAGYVGSGVSGAFLQSSLADVDYVRRVTLNVGRILAVSNGALLLEAPLLAGAPQSGMKVSPVVAFCDREGSSFFQEWSALFLAEGQQGERVFWHYPRLQVTQGIAEQMATSEGGYTSANLKATFRALPVADPVDGEQVLCFRSCIMP